MLGYEDGEEMSFQELEYIVNRIRSNVDLALTVDLEAGYSRNPDEIAKHIINLSKLGVVGINLEDSLVKGSRSLVDADVFANLLKQLCVELSEQEIDIFINVRTDTFLLACPNPVEETIKRAQKYQVAGAHGLFVPCLEKADEIEKIIHEIQLPLNVMFMPNLPDFKTLQSLGVKRISMGNFLYHQINESLKKELGNIQKT